MDGAGDDPARSAFTVRPIVRYVSFAPLYAVDMFRRIINTVGLKDDSSAEVAAAIFRPSDFMSPRECEGKAAFPEGDRGVSLGVGQQVKIVNDITRVAVRIRVHSVKCNSVFGCFFSHNFKASRIYRHRKDKNHKRGLEGLFSVQYPYSYRLIPIWPPRN